MHFSEDDLRRALKRKDPGAAFTQRVMARIHQAEAKTPAAPKKPFRLLWWPLTVRPVLAGVIIAVLAVCAWLGLRQYQRIQDRARIQGNLAGERAKQQAILALRITNAKLNHVFQRVNAPQPHDNKFRREHL